MAAAVARPTGNQGPPTKAHARPCGLLWSLSNVFQTGSRLDTISEEWERVERFEACVEARLLIEELFSDPEGPQLELSDPLELLRLERHAQALVCYYIQVFYQSASFLRHDRRVVSISVARTACQAVGCPVSMDLLLRMANVTRAKLGDSVLNDEQQRLMPPLILKAESRLLAMLPFGVQIPDPMDLLGNADEEGGMLNLALAELAKLEAFRQACGPAWRQAEELEKVKSLLAQVIHFVVLDAHMGFAPLVAPQRVLVAAALVVGIRLTCKLVTDMGKLADMLLRRDESLREWDFRKLVLEVLSVFKTKKCLEARKRKAQEDNEALWRQRAEEEAATEADGMPAKRRRVDAGSVLQGDGQPAS